MTEGPNTPPADAPAPPPPSTPESPVVPSAPKQPVQVVSNVDNRILLDAIAGLPEALANVFKEQQPTPAQPPATQPPATQPPATQQPPTQPTPKSKASEPAAPTGRYKPTRLAKWWTS